jgi:hypothetical protein
MEKLNKDRARENIRLERERDEIRARFEGIHALWDALIVADGAGLTIKVNPLVEQAAITVTYGRDQHPPVCPICCKTCKIQTNTWYYDDSRLHERFIVWEDGEDIAVRLKQAVVEEQKKLESGEIDVLPKWAFVPENGDLAGVQRYLALRNGSDDDSHYSHPEGLGEGGEGGSADLAWYPQLCMLEFEGREVWFWMLIHSVTIDRCRIASARTWSACQAAEDGLFEVGFWDESLLTDQDLPRLGF